MRKRIYRNRKDYC